jgi:hypothetical protein
LSSDETLIDWETNEIAACSNLTLINFGVGDVWFYERGISLFDVIGGTNCIRSIGICRQK